MANISQYLQDILDAVYGEQVRGSIHDAIEIINEASEVCISAGTAVSSASSSSTGFFEGSLYVNINTYDLWKCLGTNTWQNIGNLRGIGIASLEKTATVDNVDTYTITFDDGSTETFDVTNGIDGVNGSIWYKGTALTGTGTSIVGFPGVKNDFYLNSTTGAVYVCTKTGGAMVPDAAEWDYVMTLSGGGGGSSILVIDNLTSSSSTDALSANQGRVLNNALTNKANISSLSSVATSGSYNDLSNKPVFWHPTVHTYNTAAVVSSAEFLDVDPTMAFQLYADSDYGTSASGDANKGWQVTYKTMRVMSYSDGGTTKYKVVVTDINVKQSGTKLYLLCIKAN